MATAPPVTAWWAIPLRAPFWWRQPKPVSLPPISINAYPRKQEVPFDSNRKRMVTIHLVQDAHPEDISPIYSEDQREWYAVAVKGAPDIVLSLCSRYQTIDDKARILDEDARQRILAANDSMTRQALRVLGLAYRMIPVLPSEVNSEELEKDLIFAGLVGMIDPARAEVNPALETARQAGIRTIMITGDYPNTARAIAEGDRPAAPRTKGVDWRPA